jgi:hypothetical protein
LRVCFGFSLRFFNKTFLLIKKQFSSYAERLVYELYNPKLTGTGRSPLAPAMGWCRTNNNHKNHTVKVGKREEEDAKMDEKERRS